MHAEFVSCIYSFLPRVFHNRARCGRAATLSVRSSDTANTSCIPVLPTQTLRRQRETNHDRVLDRIYQLRGRLAPASHGSVARRCPDRCTPCKEVPESGGLQPAHYLLAEANVVWIVCYVGGNHASLVSQSDTTVQALQGRWQEEHVFFDLSASHSLYPTPTGGGRSEVDIMVEFAAARGRFLSSTPEYVVVTVTSDGSGNSAYAREE